MGEIVTLLLCLFVLSVVSLPTEYHFSERASHRLQNHNRSTSASEERISPHSFCFGTECRCEKDQADCSQNYGNLTFVPRLPNGIKFLNFSYNNLTAIPRQDFFANVSHLRAVDLGDNNLTYIHPRAFAVFEQLSSVFVDYNFHLTIEAIEPVLSTPTLKRLDLRHGGLLTIPDDVFRRFALPSLKTLYLHENKLRVLDFTTLTPLRALSNLGLASNQIAEVRSGLMVNLKRLNLQHNPVQHFPVTCRHGSSLFPRLMHLYLAGSLISAITGQVCLPQLVELELASSLISRFVPDMFGAHRFPSLASLQLQSQNSLRKTIGAHAFRNPSLKRLNLMYNDISFDTDFVDAHSFRGCSNLRNLQLGHNFFGGITLQKWQQLFQPLQKLQVLYLGNINLKNLSRETFKTIPSLQKLYIYQNPFSDLPDGVFDHLRLTHLGLEVNQISAVRESTFSQETRRRLKRVDLSGNPLHCSCSLLWFQSWFLSQPAVFSHSRRDYRCHNVPGTKLSAFRMNPQACLLSHDASTFIVVSIFLMMVMTILVVTVFHFRWHIRLMLYEAFRGRDPQLRRRRLQAEHFDYDVFVSYDSKDCDWVLQCLRPRLEDAWGLRLCLHQRDFVPGKNIADNIVDSVQGSKKVLMLFSPSYAASPWCQFELNYCLRHVMDFDDALVVVRLRDVTARDLTATMMAVHKVTTYIQWEQGPAEVEASFWGRLQRVHSTDSFRVM